MMRGLFFLAFVVMWWCVYRMHQFQMLLIRHRHEVVIRLGEVTVQLPVDEREASHAASVALLDQQQCELEQLRPWWKRRT